MTELTRALRADSDYAWSLHCNIAMPIMDSHPGMTHQFANISAARVMMALFGIDMTEHPHWEDFKSKWAAEPEQDANDTLVQMLTTLRRVQRVFDEVVFKEFDWGKSALSASSIGLLNEVPGELKTFIGRIELAIPAIEKRLKESETFHVIELREWQRDDVTTRDILALTGQGACVPMTAINEWTDEQCREAENWAGATHLQASDNDDVEVPPIPEHVKIWDTPERRAVFEKEMEDLMRGGGTVDTQADAQPTGTSAEGRAGSESQPPLPPDDTPLTDQELRAIEYIRNTGESVNIAQFDDDHEPIGPMLRRQLTPWFFAEDENKILKLTDEGRRILNNG